MSTPASDSAARRASSDIRTAGFAGGGAGLSPGGVTTYQVKLIGGSTTSSIALPLESMDSVAGRPAPSR